MLISDLKQKLHRYFKEQWRTSPGLIKFKISISKALIIIIVNKILKLDKLNLILDLEKICPEILKKS